MRYVHTAGNFGIVTAIRQIRRVGTWIPLFGFGVEISDSSGKVHGRLARLVPTEQPQSNSTVLPFQGLWNCKSYFDTDGGIGLAVDGEEGETGKCIQYFKKRELP